MKSARTIVAALMMAGILLVSWGAPVQATVQYYQWTPMGWYGTETACDNAGAPMVNPPHVIAYKCPFQSGRPYDRDWHLYIQEQMQ